MSTEFIVEESQDNDSKQYPRCFAVVVALVTLTAGLSLVWFLLAEEHKSGLNSTLPPGPLCQSSECANAEKMLEVIMKPEVRPCDDFYTYVCGKYEHPAGQVLLQMDVQMYKMLIQTLDTISSWPSRDQRAAQKAAALYKNCAGSSTDETVALYKFVQSVGLGLSSYADADVLEKIIMLFFKYNIAIILELSLTDFRLSRRKPILVLAMSSSQLLWMSKRRENSPLGIFYQTHMLAFGLHPLSKQALEMSENIIRAENIAMGVYFFDHYVAMAQRVGFLTMAHLDATTPNVPKGRWVSLISTHSGGVYDANDIVQVTESALTYFNRLHTYLGKQLNLLAAWELVRTLLPISSRKLATVFYAADYLTTACLSAVAQAMEVPLFSWYLFKEVPPNTVSAAREMVDDIRKSIMAEIDIAPWLDKATKATAMYKVNAMKLHVGYPTFFSSDKELDLVYQSYPTAGKNFFLPWLEAMGKTIAWRITNRSSFYFPVVRTNAGYAPFRNKIYIPASILRLPLFSPALPKAVNYGGLGAVIGHEITHAFDLQGSLYDAQGHQRNWWSNRSREQYGERLACLRRSHGNTDDTALSENVADFSGVVSAYQAFLGHGDRSTLRDLNADQLFFVASCAKWCANANATQAKHYAPWADRCKVPLKNMEAFSEAFECPAGAAMRPESRCAFW